MDINIYFYSLVTPEFVLISQGIRIIFPIISYEKWDEKAFRNQGSTSAILANWIIRLYVFNGIYSNKSWSCAKCYHSFTWW
jgi:hypothetical protein